MYDSADIRAATIQRQVHRRFARGLPSAKQHLPLEINEQQVGRL
jgi:hypothetical protein